MQDIADLQFTHFIVHVVDHKTRQLELSDLETPIDEASHFPHELFEGYVLGALTDTNRRLARFVSPESNVCKPFRDMSHPKKRQFIGLSQKIATKLYDTMNKSAYKAQINAGDIMIALFRKATDGKAEGPSYMAILKIDPTSVITRRVVEKDDHRQVVFDKSSSIPDPEQSRIQKIAVVSPTRLTEPRNHDLVILDNNLRNRLVAHFFYQDFLESKLVNTASQTTDLLFEGLKRFLSDDGDVVTPALSGGEKFQILEQAEDTIARLASLSPQMLADEAVELPKRRPKEIAALRETLIAQYGSPVTGLDEEILTRNKKLRTSGAGVGQPAR